MQININHQKVSKVFQISLFSWSSRMSGSWRNSKLEKSVPMFLKTLSLDMAIQLAYIWKDFDIKWFKGQENLQNTTVNINLHQS